MNKVNQKIIDKVHSLLGGELKNLEFGCEIILKQHLHTDFIILTVIDYLKADDIIYYDYGREMATCKKDDIRRILGKDISLHYLLKAIYTLEGDLGYMKELLKKARELVFKLWNFSLKDSLGTQLEANPALVKFLAKIFNIKE